MCTSLFSVLVFSPSTLGYESPWLKEADDLTREAKEAELHARDADPLEGFGRL